MRCAETGRSLLSLIAIAFRHTHRESGRRARHNTGKARRHSDICSAVNFDQQLAPSELSRKPLAQIAASSHVFTSETSQVSHFRID